MSTTPAESKPSASQAETTLAVSDDMTAVETGWVAMRGVAPAVAGSAARAEALSRFAELPAVARPLFRTLALAAKPLNYVGSADGLATIHGARVGFGALASVATGFEQYEASTAHTKTFKDLDAAVGGSVDFVFGMALPVTALIDGVLNFALPKIAPNIKAESGGFISGNLATAVRGAVALTEGVVTGDFGAAKEFGAKAAAGDYGLLFKGGSAACSKLADEASHLQLKTWLTRSQP